MVDVGSAIGIVQKYKVILEYVVMDEHGNSFSKLNDLQKEEVHYESKEHYLLYEDLRNDFTNGDNQ